MLKVTETVFEVLERAWQTLDHALIDMKIEFGVQTDGQLVVADVIDNDSWRLWPSGDKRLMLDKQVYRNMDASKIDAKAIDLVRQNFEIVAERTQALFTSLVAPRNGPEIAILIGSTSDFDHANKIKAALGKYSITAVDIHVCSAHKSTNYALEVVASVQQWPSAKAIIACAGRSNGLGPVASANSTLPVFNCPPMSDLSAAELDIWSSLRMPSGVGCSTVLGADNAALAVAHVIANETPLVWATIRAQKTYITVKTIHDDAALSRQKK